MSFASRLHDIGRKGTHSMTRTTALFAVVIGLLFASGAAIAQTTLSPAPGPAPRSSASDSSPSSGLWSQVGMLRCILNPNIGFTITGHESMECRFVPDSANPPQTYQGAINMVGLNLDVAAGGVLGWAVFAPTPETPVGALAGEYVGASGDIGIIAGAGTNILIGGSGRTFALQPVSLGGSVAVKVALGISVVKLRTAP
jgi:Protein of unknown function (DUF992)